MAWRDSRGSRRRLLLFLSSMVLGIAALVAINSFGESLRRNVDAEAATLLGADLSIESNRPFDPATEALLDSLGGEQARRVSLSSMAYFPRTGDTRLATVRAIEGAYPWYGSVETDPAGAARTYLQGRDALVDAALAEQFDVQIGDSVRIGHTAYRVAGRLLKTPRESTALMLFSPRIYIPLAHLDASLLATGSRAEYEVYFRFPDGTDVEAVAERIRPHLEQYRLGSDTVGEIRENWNEGLTNLYRFLSLVGFISLLLGGLGVGGAVHVYVRQRIETVAIIRCLGASSWRVVGVYLAQAGLMGLTGGILGVTLGVGLQWLIPRVLADFLPVAVPFLVSWRAALLGFGIGVGVTLLFALLPLLAVRRVSPLRALRTAAEPEPAAFRDPLRLLVMAALALAVALFAQTQTPDWRVGLAYTGGVFVVFGALALVARLIMFLARRFMPASWPFPLRQGLANLYRPNNQTVLLLIAIGLGTYLITTLLFVERTLLAPLPVAARDDVPNLVLFDIQPDQLDSLETLVAAQALPVLDRTPVVTMRLASVAGRDVEEARRDSADGEGSWAFTREYRSTYRGHLTEAEKLVEGSFVDSASIDDGPVPVTLERDIAAELAVGVGDTLVFNVQGVPLETRVAGIREVDWRRLSTNFFVVFPRGVLEDAPQFYIVLSRTPDEKASARLQETVVQAFPNVSAIDLSLVLSVFDAIFSRIRFVIQFMALFSIVTGLVVLAGAVVISRFQRLGESVLLKTLGASRRVVFQVMLAEYALLGFFAALTGLVLSLGSGWALARFVFETPFHPGITPVVVAVVVVMALTVAVGLFNSRGIYDRPALEVLRSEG